MIKETDKRKEQVIQNCNQKHPLYFFNNLGVLHFHTKKYSLAAYFLSKALKYLSLDGKQSTKQDMSSSFISNHTTQKRAEIMHNLGLAFYKLQEYEKCMNCFSEASELYSDKYSMWFWMGVCCVKHYMTLVEKTSLELNDNGIYRSKFNYPFPYNLNKPSHAKSKKSKLSIAHRPTMYEIDEKTPEKLRLDSAIKYFQNVILAYDIHNQKSAESVELVKCLDLRTNLENIPKIREGEETKGDTPIQDNSYSQNLYERAKNDRYTMMVKNSYMFLIYCYLVLKNTQKALDYAKILKSDYKLSSKNKFELNMFLAEIFLEQNQPLEAIKCLRVDEAFEDAKNVTIGTDSSGNLVTIENVMTGIKEKQLPKHAIMWLNIAT